MADSDYCRVCEGEGGGGSRTRTPRSSVAPIRPACDEGMTVSWRCIMISFGHKEKFLPATYLFYVIFNINFFSANQ